jgi:uncharacterized membrane protein (UPF0182 family)
MQLPDEEQEDFLLMRPFSPLGSNANENTLLTAFMVATSDGRLRTYQMPRGDLPEGPANIASAMTTDEDVSNLETNLGLSDSRVFFGNLVLVPIEESLLYVRPFYVEPQGDNKIPELLKVIVYFEGEIAIEDTLEEALVTLFGDAPDTGEDEGEAVDPGDEEPAPDEELDIDELLLRASDALADADAALAEGDLGEYQAKVEEAQELLAEAQAARGGGTTTTTAPDDTDEPEGESS